MMYVEDAHHIHQEAIEDFLVESVLAGFTGNVWIKPITAPTELNYPPVIAIGGDKPPWPRALCYDLAALRC